MVQVLVSSSSSHSGDSAAAHHSDHTRSVVLPPSPLCRHGELARPAGWVCLDVGVVLIVSDDSIDSDPARQDAMIWMD